MKMIHETFVQDYDLIVYCLTADALRRRLMAARRRYTANEVRVCFTTLG